MLAECTARDGTLLHGGLTVKFAPGLELTDPSILAAPLVTVIVINRSSTRSFCRPVLMRHETANQRLCRTVNDQLPKFVAAPPSKSCQEPAMTKPGTPPKATDKGGEPRKRGWEEIESLFDDKKKKKESEKAAEGDEKAKRSRQHTKKRQPPATSRDTAGRDWVDDGLGGKFNSEGFTGRVEDGVKIFKAHILYKNDSGQTKDCPFDCKCCFI